MPNLKDITAYIEIYKLLKDKKQASKTIIKRHLADIYPGDKSLTDKVLYRLIKEMNLYLNLDIYYDESTKDWSMNQNSIKPLQFQLLNQFASLDFYQDIYLNYNEEVEKYIDAEGDVELGEVYLKKVLESLKKQKWIYIKYQTFKSDQIKEHLVAPLLLKQYDHRWYLLAVKEGDPNKTGIKSQDAAILFGLERIKDLSLTDREIEKDIFEKLPAYVDFKENSITKPIQIFDHLIGVRFTDETNALKTEVIELHFTKELAPYILSKPFHKSQEIIKDDESGLHIKLYLKVNQELKNLILSYGPGVKVLYPESLKSEIKTALKEALKHY